MGAGDALNGSDCPKLELAGCDGKMRIRQIGELLGHEERVWHVTHHSTLPLLASCSADKSVKIYNTRTLELVATLEGQHTRSVRSTAWRPGDLTVLAAASFDSTISIWERDDDYGEWECTATLEGHENEAKGVAWSNIPESSSQYLATCSRDKSVWVWQVEDDEFECLAVLQEHAQDVKCVAWHPAEDLLVSGSYDDTIRFYRPDQDDFVQAGVANGHEQTIWSLSFSPQIGGFEDDNQELDKFRLVSASDDKSIRIWRRQFSSAPPSYPVPSILAKAPVENWIEEQVLESVHTRSIYTVDWSKHGIASCGGDGRLVIWRSKTSTGHGPFSIYAVRPSAHGTWEVNSVCWGPDGRLFTAGDDGVIRIWTID